MISRYKQNGWSKKHPESTDKPISTTNVKNYTLEKTTLFSRHNIRAPFADESVGFNNLSAHEWIKWTSEDAYLTMRGGVLETLMGQYFRKYFARHNLFVEQAIPNSEEVRVYANSRQRTIATAKFFISGVFPVANIPVEYHEQLDVDDEKFGLKVPFLTEHLKATIEAELHQFSPDNDFNLLLWSLKDNFTLLEKVTNFKNSIYAKKTQISAYDLDDIGIEIATDKHPELTGSLRIALNASDALILQYYEEESDLKASFGISLNFEEWQAISAIKDLYCDVLFTPPTLAKLLVKELAHELHSELINNNRKLSVLVGHDINIGGLLSAIGAYDYILPYTIEKRTPIGSKIVIEKWKGQDGQDYASIQLVYFSLEQMRKARQIDLDNPPMRFDLTIKGLEKNHDGLYRYEDVVNTFKNVVDEVKEWEHSFKNMS